MACMFTFDNATCSLEVSREGAMVHLCVLDRCAVPQVCIDRDIDIRDLLERLLVTPAQLRWLAQEMESDPEEMDS